MSTQLPIEKLINSRCRELGIDRAEFARRTGRSNQAKVLRRLDELLQGETRSTRGLIEVLPAVLEVSGVEVAQAVADTRTYLTEQAEAAWRASFVPHAVIETERFIPSPIWVVAVLGAENLLRNDLDASRGEQSYVEQTLDELRKRRKECHGSVPGFGAPTGFTINYSSDRAILYALNGRFIEERAEARRIGRAWLTIR